MTEQQRAYQTILAAEIANLRATIEHLQIGNLDQKDVESLDLEENHGTD